MLAGPAHPISVACSRRWPAEQPVSTSKDFLSTNEVSGGGSIRARGGVQFKVRGWNYLAATVRSSLYLKLPRQVTIYCKMWAFGHFHIFHMIICCKYNEIFVVLVFCRRGDKSPAVSFFDMNFETDYRMSMFEKITRWQPDQKWSHIHSRRGNSQRQSSAMARGSLTVLWNNSVPKKHTVYYSTP